MLYIKNLPLWERALRIGAGTAAAAYAALNMSGVWGWAIVGGGVGAALMGLFGFCPACALAGRCLAKRTLQE